MGTPPAMPAPDRATGAIHLSTLADYSRVVVAKAATMGAKGVWGYGSTYMRSGDTPLHEVLKRDEATDRWVIDKVADQMWIVPSIWGIVKVVAGEMNWDFSYRLIFNAAYGLLSAFGFSPRYVSLDVTPPPGGRFTAELASGEVVDVIVPMKMGFWTRRGLALHTWPWFRCHPFFGQLELSLPLRLTKAGVTRLYAADAKTETKMEMALFRARRAALQIVFNRLPINRMTPGAVPFMMDDLMKLIYGVSYLAEAERGAEGETKVPELLAMDREAIPLSFLITLGYFLGMNRSSITTVSAQAAGENPVIRPADIDLKNFWDVGFFKVAPIKGGAPDPQGQVCRKSYRYTMVGNIILGVMVRGRVWALAYANRKLEANHAVVFATGEPARVESFIMGPWRIPWIHREISVPFGRSSILWALYLYGRGTIGRGDQPSTPR